MKTTIFTLLTLFCLASLICDSVWAEQINGKPHFGQTDTEMMNRLSTPLEYRAWVLANRYWLIGAGFGGFSNDLRGGHYATCENEPRRMFKNYFPEKEWDFDEWAHKKKPKGLDEWLEKEGLGKVLVESCNPQCSNLEWKIGYPVTITGFIVGLSSDWIEFSDALDGGEFIRVSLDQIVEAEG